MEKLESQLSELYASGDQQAAAAAGRRLAELRPVVDAFRERRTTETDLAEAREMLSGEPDAEMREYLESEIATKQALVETLDAAPARAARAARSRRRQERHRRDPRR